jgi:polar amino acid transport system substrate-binding protein
MNRRQFAFWLGGVAASFLAPWVLQAEGLDDVRRSGVLRVAVPQDFAPFGIAGTDLEPRGYDVDVARLLADGLGVRLELVPVTSVNRIPYLQTGKVDVVVSSLGRNAEREKVIDFSVPYAPFFSGVFGPPQIPVKSADELAGLRVGVTRGAIEDLELSRIVPPTTAVKRYEDNAGTISAFLSGQVDLIATGNVVAAALAAQKPAREPSLRFLIKSSPCHIGVRKGEPQLLQAVNAVISRARADGSLDRIAVRWLGAPLPMDL